MKFENGGPIPPVDDDDESVCLLSRGWWKCKDCGALFESWVQPPAHICTDKQALLPWFVINPLTNKRDGIANVLHMLAAQENCDGEPYDQMQVAADYISHLEQQVDILFKMARLVRNTDGLYPSTWGREASHLLLKLRSLSEDRYQKEVMER